MKTRASTNCTYRRRASGFLTGCLFLFTLFLCIPATHAGPYDKTGTQWAPYLEWSIQNSSVSGNPFDLIATVAFTHQQTGEKRVTGMFYDGSDTWKFRFAGTQPGTWTFKSTSGDPELNGISGTVTIQENPGVHGFVTHDGEKWMRQGTNQAFVPQYIMYAGPAYFHSKPEKIDADIQTFMVEHGFTGFHVPIMCMWFDINNERSDAISRPDPDLRTFEALDLLITKVHKAGGLVHLWAWGDESRKQTPAKWGINGVEDKRLQRYIAARLGPLPGWTMGYGYDLWEWVNESQLANWHSYMQEHMAWDHYLGARAGKNQLNQIYEGMDYSSYEQHKPDYQKYVETITRRPSKPSFSEDRFRIGGSSKDYSFTETRRGLWHAAMAGGVANIWGNLSGGCDEIYSGLVAPCTYPNPEWIRTNTTFFDKRFTRDLVRANGLTDGYALKGNSNNYIFYKENAQSIRMDLSGMSEPRPAVAVDTLKPYKEIAIGTYAPGVHQWEAPYASDWAISIESTGTAAPSPPAPPAEVKIIEAG